MFFWNLLPQEIPVMENYIKTKVREITGIFFKEHEGYIPRKYKFYFNKNSSEVPYLVRYFLQYPSQTQVVDEILPEIEKLDLDDKKGKEFVQIEAFEKHLLTSIIFLILKF